MNSLSPAEMYAKEGWEIRKQDNKYFTTVEGRDFEFKHPFHIHAALYADSKDKDHKFKHLKAMHDYAWPHYVPLWNHWEERIFRAWCDDSIDTIVLAGGASCGKSMVTGKLNVLDWMSAPFETGCIVASTDLDSLEKRIYGYVRRCVDEIQVPFKFYESNGNKPKIKSRRQDKIHSISAVPSKKGGQAQSINHLIGTHPKKNLRMTIDEATDCPAQVLGSKINLTQGVVNFKLIIVGNSMSHHDLHGSLATPLKGWDSINWEVDDEWPTESGGICLYFNPFKSPAITDPDPEKRRRLSQYFMTTEKIQKEKEKYGENSPEFWRMVLGFWPKTSIDETVLTKQFLSEFNAERAAEWSGMRSLYKVAGLDPSFTQGGDKCVLRIATLGTDTRGRVLLDYSNRGIPQIHIIKILASSAKDPNLQIADQVIKILQFHGIPLDFLAIDANGSGRGLADLIAVRANSVRKPIQIWSTNSTKRDAVHDHGLILKSALDLWLTFKDFIQEDSIRGMDLLSLDQMCQRKLEYNIERNILSLESKTDYKARMRSKSPRLAFSPDEADAACITLQAAIIKYGFSRGQIDLELIESTEEPTTYLGREAPKDSINVRVVRRPLKSNYGSGKGFVPQKRSVRRVH